MTKTNKKWIFKGGVEVNHICRERNLEMTTWAPSKKKALNNLRYRYKIENRLSNANSVEFFGKIEAVERIAEAEKPVQEPESQAPIEQLSLF